MPRRNDLPVCGSSAVSSSSACAPVIGAGRFEQRDRLGDGAALRRAGRAENALRQAHGCLAHRSRASHDRSSAQALAPTAGTGRARDENRRSARTPGSVRPAAARNSPGPARRPSRRSAASSHAGVPAQVPAQRMRHGRQHRAWAAGRDTTAQRAPVRCCSSAHSCAVCSMKRLADVCELTSLTPSAVTTTSAGCSAACRSSARASAVSTPDLRHQLPGHGAPSRSRQAAWPAAAPAPAPGPRRRRRPPTNRRPPGA